jgi:acetylornithine deacetylase
MPAALSTVDILDRLIAFDTISANSNLALIDWVADHLDGLGVPVRLVRDATGTKANLWATVGPDDRGGVVLSGHTDVVPVAEQPWTSDPFTLVRRDDRLFGRGTADMKGFVALCIAAVPDLLARRLRTPVHLGFTYDEEIGCFGARTLVADVIGNLPRPRLAIIGEPTEMRVVNAHKGGCRLRCTIRGVAAHGSQPQLGANAIVYAAEVVRFVRDLDREFREAADPDSPFVPPFTSFNVGTIQGGVASNVVAPSCEVGFEFRAMPGTDPDAIVARVRGFLTAELLPRLKAEHPDADIALVKTIDIQPLVPDPESEAEQVVRRLTGANASHVVSFGTEAGVYQANGIPAVVCGPGSIDQAHKPDEFIALDQLAKGERFLRAVADWAATG